MAVSIFRKKTIAEAKGLAVKTKLKRELNTLEVFFLVIGATIGAGIFVLPGVAAAKHAGPAVALSFLLGGIVCICVGLCYVEFAGMAPVAGSAYTYAYLSLGEIFGWVIGWDLLFEFTVVCSTVAVGWSGYFVEFLKSIGLNLPKYLTTNAANGGLVNLTAVLAVLIVGSIAYSGIKNSGRANAYLTLIKLATLAVFIIFAVPFIKFANYHPFFAYGWGGVMTGAALTFFAYTGFDGVTTVIEEVKDPQRSLPVALVGGLVCVTLLYVIVSLVMTGVIPYTKLNVSDPTAFTLISVGKRWGGALVSVGAIFGLFTAMLANGLSSTRILFSMSRDGLLPPLMSKLHKKFRVPYVATLLVFGVALLLAGFLSVDELAQLANIGGLIAFLLTAVSTLVMRVTHPDAKRTFRVPAIWLVAPIGALGAIALIASLPMVTYIRFISWMVVGFIIYFGYGIKHSLLRDENDSASTGESAG